MNSSDDRAQGPARAVSVCPGCGQFLLDGETRCTQCRSTEIRRIVKVGREPDASLLCGKLPGREGARRFYEGVLERGRVDAETAEALARLILSGRLTVSRFVGAGPVFLTPGVLVAAARQCGADDVPVAVGCGGLRRSPILGTLDGAGFMWLALAHEKNGLIAPGHEIVGRMRGLCLTLAFRRIAIWPLSFAIGGAVGVVVFLSEVLSAVRERVETSRRALADEPLAEAMRSVAHHWVSLPLAPVEILLRAGWIRILESAGCLWAIAAFCGLLHMDGTILLPGLVALIALTGISRAKAEFGERLEAARLRLRFLLSRHEKEGSIADLALALQTRILDDVSVTDACGFRCLVDRVPQVMAARLTGHLLRGEVLFSAGMPYFAILANDYPCPVDIHQEHWASVADYLRSDRVVGHVKALVLALKAKFAQGTEAERVLAATRGCRLVEVSADGKPCADQSLARTLMELRAAKDGIKP